MNQTEKPTRNDVELSRIGSCNERPDAIAIL
jgi:hypothetical protein